MAVYGDPSRSLANFSVVDIEYADSIDPVGISTWTNALQGLGRFKQKGGKLLTFHGTRDPVRPILRLLVKPPNVYLYRWYLPDSRNGFTSFWLPRFRLHVSTVSPTTFLICCLIPILFPGRRTGNDRRQDRPFLSAVHSSRYGALFWGTWRVEVWPGCNPREGYRRDQPDGP
jgi:hypothetical protein